MRWLDLIIAAPLSIAPAPEAATVTTPFGSITVAQPQRDAAYAEGMAARDAARKILRLRNICLAITDARLAPAAWGTTTSTGWPVYPWSFEPAGPPSYVLRHEIGHDLFTRFLVPNTRPGQYGSDAPDWLDEMAAVAFEGEAQQQLRRNEAARLAGAGRLPKLRAYLTMNHPEADARPATDTGAQGATSANTPGFYAMTRVFYDFLVERTGSPAIVADLAKAFRRGEDLTSFILARLNRKQDAAAIDRLDAALLTWLSHDRRYRSIMVQGAVLPTATGSPPIRVGQRCRPGQHGGRPIFSNAQGQPDGTARRRYWHRGTGGSDDAHRGSCAADAKPDADAACYNGFAGPDR